ncbi:MAG: hypothetical protein K2J70_03965 [Muribaculaceae bacterium]|nr:hypothetical protein [Muribaculaceae bacterium]
MMPEVSSNKRIAKNTVFLYIRMAVAMLIALYTSRVILEVLGITRYGIWSLVFTVIGSLSFLSSPLTASTQRFFNVALAEKDIEKVREIFRTSVFLYFLLSAILLIIFETVGLWFLTHKLDIPREYTVQTHFLYQCAVVSFILQLYRLPYDSIIIAKEKFNFIAVIGIIESFLRLGIVFLVLVFRHYPALTVLGFLTLSVTVLIQWAYIAYAKKNFPQYLSKGRPKDQILRKEMTSYSGWNTFGVFAAMTSNQGIGIIVNMFFGVTVNAALGITNQVSNSLTQLVGNFQKAFQPQIVKRYTADERRSLLSLLQVSTKLSYLLVFIVGCPVIFNIDTILSIWLKEIPPLTSIFCIYMIICGWVDSTGGPFWMVIGASGRIRNYQIAVGCALLITILISFCLFELGFPPQVIFQVKLLVAFFSMAVRIFYMKKCCNISIRWVLKTILLPLFLITLFGVAIMWGLRYYIFPSQFGGLIGGGICFFILLLPIAFLISFNSAQRRSIMNTLIGKLKK